MFPAPQDKFVELHQNDDNDAGRYAVAKMDIKCGDLVLLADPYAIAINPNESVSAMYLAAKIHKWDDKMGKQRTATATLSTPATTSCVGKRPDDAAADYPPTHSAALCCSCLKIIPTGTPLLNYETIRQVSIDVAAEHAEEEMQRQQQRLRSTDHTTSAEDGIEDTDTGALHGEEKAKKTWQKPTRSTRMRSKGYIALKAKLTAQREAAAAVGSYASDEPRRGDWFRAAQPLAWPERAIHSQSPHSEDTDDSKMIGCCGCAGCGVAMYCSARCWEEFHAQHASSGECRALRRVYPELMRTYFTKHTAPAGRHVSSHLWDPAHWLRHGSEDTAWEFQSLLLAALVADRCAMDGFAAHLAEPAEMKDLTGKPLDVQKGITDTLNASPEICVEGGDGHPAINTPETTTTAAAAAVAAGNDKDCDSDHAAAFQHESNNNSHSHDSGNDDVAPDCDSSSALHVARGAVVNRGVATDSAVPREVENIRATRERLGVSLEVLDSMAAQSPPGAGADWLAMRPPHWSDVARLVTNLSVMPKEYRAASRMYHRAFAQHVAPWLGLEVSAGAFDRMSAAANCNGFGVYSAKDHCLAIGLYPAASYFNHSCQPNLCRVMRGGRVAAFYAIRDIAHGEPLSICYVDVQETSTAERRRLLLTSYRFYCQCERCSGAATAASGIQLCNECTTRGYLRPLQGSDEAECTICRTRKPWQTSGAQA